MNPGYSEECEEIPTAPPTPGQAKQGMGLRRHDTLFFEPAIDAIQSRNSDDSEECEGTYSEGTIRSFFDNLQNLIRYVSAIEIPTAPPTPVQDKQGRGLRRHDTLFFEPAVYSSIRSRDPVTRQERLKEVSLHDTPPSELPPNSSLEQFLKQRTNSRRLNPLLDSALGL
ncbi:hypothetical protein EV361DRAFT_956305 [Lentinula raphanica]|nr:hypothetical protein EV361DRAFT_956305 [Lentinula raphanica]